LIYNINLKEIKMMKNIKYIVIAGVFFLGACQDFLQEDPVDRLTQFNFYSTADDAKSAVDAVYNKLWVGYYERDLQLLVDVTCDDVKNGGGMQNAFLQELEFMRYTPDNNFIRGVWQYGYDMINKANVAIHNIEDESIITMDETVRKGYVGEAKFLRGLAYFNKVRLWGSVPLITYINDMSDAYSLGAPVDDIYAQIIEDLTYAVANLPDTYPASDYGRVTKGAAQITLGKVYLTLERWQDAADILNDVVTNEGTYGYGLYDNYQDNWEVSTQHGIENVLGIDYTGDINGNKLMQATAPKYAIIGKGVLPGLAAGWESEVPSIETYNLFDDADERKNSTFQFDFIGPKDGKTYTADKPIIAKYWEENETSAKKCDLDFMIIRYSDCLLMLAEALNELGQTGPAYIHLNRVRERAFNDPTYNYSGLSKDQFRDAVLLERRLEFVHEGHRFFDLKRTGRFVQRMKDHGAAEFALTGELGKQELAANVSSKYLLLPIPQREIDLNPDLKQNPEY
jgi:hypothetical protein